jgi:RimJ/RimL family protein N-acetyltransferase
MKLHSIEARISAENIASASLLEATGFVKEGHLKEDFFFRGKFSDTIIYSRINKYSFFLLNLIHREINMLFREAIKADIPQIQIIRNSVTENMLSDPALVPDTDVEDYLFRRGKGWVCEIENKIVGFAIVSVTDKNVWALFILPGFDKKGIGSRLHREMLNWYFSRTHETIWLSTSPGTRAEQFYRNAGWTETGLYGKGEIRFEMTAETWKNGTENAPN